MNSSVLYSIGIAFLIPLGVKTAMYFTWFKRKQYRVSLLTCFLLAGSPLIPVGLIGIPVIIGWLAGVGVAFYILSQYTSVDIIPVGMISIFGIEIFYAFLDRYVLQFLIS